MPLKDCWRLRKGVPNLWRDLTVTSFKSSFFHQVQFRPLKNLLHADPVSELIWETEESLKNNMV